MKKMFLPMIIGLLPFCFMSCEVSGLNYTLRDCMDYPAVAQQVVTVLVTDNLLNDGDNAVAALSGNTAAASNVARDALDHAGYALDGSDLRAKAEVDEAVSAKDALVHVGYALDGSDLRAKAEVDAAFVSQNALTSKGYAPDGSDLELSCLDAQLAEQVAIPFWDIFTDPAYIHVLSYPSVIWRAAVESNIEFDGLWDKVKDPHSDISTATFTDDAALANLTAHMTVDELQDDEAMKFIILKVCLIAGKSQADVNSFNLTCSDGTVTIGSGGLGLKL